MGELDLIDERLLNWARWAKDRIHYRITPSLEGRYKAPPCWHPPEPKTFVDLNDAYKVEKAIIKIPEKFRNLIIYEYIKPYLNYHKTIKRLKIADADFHIQSTKAKNMVKNRLIAIDNEHVV